MALEGSTKLRFKRHLLSKKGIAGIIIVLTISVLIIYPEVIPWYSNHNMDWNAEIGDTLTFNVTYTPIQPRSENQADYWMIDLVGIEVVFEVSSLPTIPRVVRSENFVEDVILPIKVICYFPNSSLLPSSYSSHLTRFVSNCILPVNGSLLLDSLYPDKDISSLLGAKGTFYYFQESSSETMVIASTSFWYFDYGHAGGGIGWYGECSQETGIPHQIVFVSYASLSTGPAPSERITLTLVN